MFDAMVWPHRILPPADIAANPVAYSRSGGRSLGGLERVTRTDRGYWSIDLLNITLGNPAQRRTFNAIRTKLAGRGGYIAVPVRARESAPWPDGVLRDFALVTHSDGTRFSDGSKYRQRTIDLQMNVAAALGASVVLLRLVRGAADLSGIRFSYRHAMYETGPAIAIEGDVWQVPIVPSIRAAIPAGADLEADLPTCLCHLASDDAMGSGVSVPYIDRVSVSFVEAVDYWNDLALAA